MHTRAVALLVVFAPGCEEEPASKGGRDDDGTFWGVDLGDPADWIDPLEYSLAATTTAGWLGSIGVAWVTDGAHPCAVQHSDGSLEITPGPACPHPLLEDLGGTARLELPSGAGYTFSASAEGLDVGGRGLLAGTFPFLQAAPVADLVEVVFSTSDYGEETVWGWVVRVRTGGTADLADDGVELVSASFTAETLPDDWEADDRSVGLLLQSLTLSPECRRNPVLGAAIIENSSYWPLLSVEAHPECDGRIHIDSTQQEEEWTPTLDLLRGQ